MVPTAQGWDVGGAIGTVLSFGWGESADIVTRACPERQLCLVSQPSVLRCSVCAIGATTGKSRISRRLPYGCNPFNIEL